MRALPFHKNRSVAGLGQFATRCICALIKTDPRLECGKLSHRQGASDDSGAGIEVSRRSARFRPAVSRIADFIEQHHDEILGLYLGRTRRMAAATGLTEPELVDVAPAYLSDLAH